MGGRIDDRWMGERIGNINGHNVSVCDICLHVCVYLQVDPWVTQDGTDPLPLEEEHCTVIEVTEEEVQNSVKFVPSLSAVVSETECKKHALLNCSYMNTHKPNVFSASYCCQ